MDVDTSCSRSDHVSQSADALTNCLTNDFSFVNAADDIDPSSAQYVNPDCRALKIVP